MFSGILAGFCNFGELDAFHGWDGGDYNLTIEKLAEWKYWREWPTFMDILKVWVSLPYYKKSCFQWNLAFQAHIKDPEGWAAQYLSTKGSVDCLKRALITHSLEPLTVPTFALRQYQLFRYIYKYNIPNIQFVAKTKPPSTVNVT